jgi:hypothetical protein
MKELQDNELLEFLMTSDFSDDYKSEELKYLLHKFKYFYRILHGKNSHLISQKDFEIDNLRSEIEGLKKVILNTQVENAELRNTIDLQPSVKKLTLMERILGKVDLKNNNKK